MGASSPDAKAFIDGELGKHQVVVFSKSYCPYCSKTKSLFGQSEFKDIDVATYELDQRGDGAAIQQTLLSMSGQRTVPSVWVGGKLSEGIPKHRLRTKVDSCNLCWASSKKRINNAAPRRL